MKRLRQRLLVATVTALLSGTVAAQEPTAQPIAFDIDSQPVSSALKAFANQSGLQLLFHVEGVALPPELKAPEVNGMLTPEAALQQLLQNTGLRFEFINSRTVTIRPARQAESDLKSGATTDAGRHLRLAAAQAGKEPGERAQSATADTAASDGASSRIEEIIVTAQKRVERLIDVPQSISVISADELARRGVTQFRDFADTIPGLTFTTTGAGFTQISLRGVTVGTDASPTVGIYVDEVPYGSSSVFARGNNLALDVGLFDVERIEVLRGPQGTLYGASTMGGLLKYVSKQPVSTDFSVEARSGVSSGRDAGVGYNGALAVNAPITADSAALRASGFYSHDGGYIDNVELAKDDVNRADIYGGRLDVLLTPTDALEIRLTAFAQNISRDGDAVAGFTLAGDPIDDSLDQRRAIEESFDQHFRLASGTLTYDFGAATLTSISSYQRMDVDTVGDFNYRFGVLLPIFGLGSIGAAGAQALDKFTQEVRLASDRQAGQSFEWVLGGFYTHEDSDSGADLVLRDLDDEPVENFIYSFTTPSIFEEYAAFGSLTWYLTPQLDVSGGIRVSQNRQKFQQLETGLLVGGAAATPLRRSQEDVSTYLANARYRFGERAIGYVRFATGYRPGGPNFAAVDPVTGVRLAPDEFAADRLKSYELGFKAETPGRRFGFDVAAYHIDWSNIQVAAFLGTSVILNAPGGAAVDGGELSFSARPTNDLLMTAAFGYQRAELSGDEPLLGGRDGSRLPNVPRFTGNLGLDYTFSRRSLQPRVGGSVRYVSDRSATFGPAPYELPDYVMMDLRAGIGFDSIDLQFYVHNVFDERAQASGLVRDPLAYPMDIAILQPRTIGIVATVQF